MNAIAELTEQRWLERPLKKLMRKICVSKGNIIFSLRSIDVNVRTMILFPKKTCR